MPPIRPRNYTRKNERREAPIPKRVALLPKLSTLYLQNEELLRLEEKTDIPSKARLEYLRHVSKLYRDAKKKIQKAIETDELSALFKNVHINKSSNIGKSANIGKSLKISKEIKKNATPDVSGLVASHLRMFERIKEIYYDTYALCMTIKSEFPEDAASVDDLLNKATTHFKNAILYFTDITIMQKEYPKNIIKYPDSIYKRQVFLNQIHSAISKIYYDLLKDRVEIEIEPDTFSAAEKFTDKLLEDTIKDATVIVKLLYHGVEPKNENENNPAGARAEGGAPAAAADPGFNASWVLGAGAGAGAGAEAMSNNNNTGAGTKKMSNNNSVGGGHKTRRRRTRR